MHSMRHGDSIGHHSRMRLSRIIVELDTLYWHTWRWLGYRFSSGGRVCLALGGLVPTSVSGVWDVTGVCCDSLASLLWCVGQRTRVLADCSFRLGPLDARHRPPGAVEGEAAGLGNATSGSATDRATREHKMTVDEAQLILNVKPDASLEEIVKRYELLFKQNSPPAPPEKAGAAAGAAPKKSAVPTWSHYLQSKVVRARERLEAETKVAAEDGVGKQSAGKAEEKPDA
ncbi:hypothetical protein FRC06_000366 [Ceratobasidium sp. 370]|nr:hypothetical protein FRC06_000366 [Ceratobasidium sp. 370]